MCLYVLREKCTGVQKNSAFGALRGVKSGTALRKLCNFLPAQKAKSDSFTHMPALFTFVKQRFPAEDISRVAQKRISLKKDLLKSKPLFGGDGGS